MKFKVGNIPILFIVVGIFILPFGIRNIIAPKYAPVNLLVLIGLMLGINNRVFKINFFNKKGLILLFSVCIMLLLLFYVKGNGWAPINKIKRAFVYIFPLIFVYIEFADYKKFKNSIFFWYKALRLVSYLMVLEWIVDFVIGGKIEYFITQLYNALSIEQSFNGGRFISYYGHPLESAMFFIAFLIWTLLLSEKYKSKSYIYDVAVGILGIAICGSKFGLFLGLLIVLYFHLGFKRIKYLLAIIVALTVLYFAGVFDMVLTRLFTDIQAGNISTNRNKYLVLLISNGTLTFEWFHGHTFIREIEGMTPALEYPVIAFSFMCGIAMTICIYIGYFFIPIVKAIKTKPFKMVACLLILMIYVQGNNGICSVNDDLLFYAINCGFALQFFKWEYNSKGRIEKNDKSTSFNLVDGSRRSTANSN